MKSKLFILLLAVIFVLGLSSVGEVKAADPIKLGAILPLADITGDQAAKAMKLAVKKSTRLAGSWDARSSSSWSMMR